MLKDLSGKDFGVLHVICLQGVKDAKSGQKRIWKCRCRCGKEVFLPTYKLTSGATKSCGCIIDDMNHKASRSNVSCISYDKNKNKYRARISRYNKTYCLGRFDNYKDAENIVLIAKTFSDINDFNQWFSNKRESYEHLKLICEKNEIATDIIVQSLFDTCYGNLYNDVYELEQFIKDFATTYNNSN